MERVKPRESYALQVFATDLDRDAIDKARQGVFPDNIAASVSPERLSRFFSREGHGYRVRKEIREAVILAPQNLLMDPPFTKLDILSCRNLLIYLTPEMQKKLLPLFYYSLNPGGILFLGNAETIGGFTDRFAPVSSRSRIFRRMESAVRPEPRGFPPAFALTSRDGPEARGVPKPPLSLQSLADQLVLQRYAPATVLANDKGDILYTSGRTGRYLEPAAGKANWNVFAMAREGLRYELASAFRKALRQKGPVTLPGLKVGTNGGELFVDLTVQTLEEAEPLRGLVMIVFADVAAPRETKTPGRRGKAPARSARMAELELELRQARDELQTTREEMETSQEELTSTNEEFQSTNEELQSTNEELTTSKEEMQSLNEELQTVNAELQAKMDDLSRMNSDLKNLLNSTDVATVFLDSDLHVRRFTPQASKIIKLIPADEGRPITDLASDLHYPELVEDTREVLRTLAPTEKPITACDGRWFTVRIMPYRTLDDRIDGVVITFADITTAKTLEAKLRGQHAGLEKRVAEQSARLDQERKNSQTDALARKRVETGGGRSPGSHRT
jgi:PAS domain-containing protein